MLSLQALYVAYKQVKKNRGAAGNDGQSIDDFTQNLEKELNQLLLELKEKRYQAQPVKRVEIDKDDGGKRLLGIPTVRDRIVQQCLSNIMTPIFDPQNKPLFLPKIGHFDPFLTHFDPLLNEPLFC